MATSKSTEGPVSFPQGPALPRRLTALPRFPTGPSKTSPPLSLAQPCSSQRKDTGSPGKRRTAPGPLGSHVPGNRGHGPRVQAPQGRLVASSGHPHLAAEPVTVGLLVNLHDDVVHLCDPHKPVALQEPGRELGSALEPGVLSLHGARGIGGNRASLPTRSSPGQVGAGGWSECSP